MTLVFLKNDWKYNLLNEEGLTCNNNLITALIRMELLPSCWPYISHALERYYSDNGYDIRRLLAAIADVVAMPSYCTDQHINNEEAVAILRMINAMLVGSNWSDQYNPDLSGDYDSSKYELWLSGLYRYYDDAVRAIELYKAYAPTCTAVDMTYRSRYMDITENDIAKLDFYKSKAREIEDAVKKHMPPASYVDIMINNWDFFTRFERRPQSELEFCILCCSQPLASASMVRDLRIYLTQLSHRYLAAAQTEE